MAKIVEASQENITKAGRVITSGGVVVFPTETVYGLAASAFDDDAVRSIFELKGRPSDNPLIVHIADMQDLEKVVSHVPVWVRSLMEKFWPGPISFVLSKHPNISKVATANLSTVSVRMPKHEIAISLIRASGVPLVAPSANISGRPSPTNAHSVTEDFQDSNITILDGGDCEVGIESTVLLCEENKGIIVRPGIITKEMLQEYSEVQILEGWGDKISKPLSPGTKYKHYAPQASVFLVSRFPVLQDSNTLWCEFESKRNDVVSLQEKNVYEIFRQADRDGVREIYILDNPKIQSQKALYNRIQKASEK